MTTCPLNQFKSPLPTHHHYHHYAKIMKGLQEKKAACWNPDARRSLTRQNNSPPPEIHEEHRLLDDRHGDYWRHDYDRTNGRISARRRRRVPEKVLLTFIVGLCKHVGLCSFDLPCFLLTPDDWLLSHEPPIRVRAGPSRATSWLKIPSLRRRSSPTWLPVHF